METAIKYIQSATIDFLKEKIGKLTDYREANELLIHSTGIDTFFRNQKDFLTLLKLLEPSFIVCEGIDRREYGDFQTPYELTNLICSYLNNEGISPDIIIEPTFGKGSFLISALKYFPQLNTVYGIEIYEPYYWQTKFAVLELFIKNPGIHKPKIFLYLDDVFKFDFTKIERGIGNYKILILGNPPWITNSELGSLNSKNLPNKTNFKSLNGLEAITGKGNFDICEYIILIMLKLFAKYNGYMAILAKNSVIKNLIYDLPTTNYTINDITALKIAAREYFNASIEASLFKCNLGSSKSSFTCKASSFISPRAIENEFGWIDNKFVSNITLYKRNKKYDGVSPFIWRQGVKHDCSKIMELQLIENKYINGFKKELDIERELIFGLIKSSDLHSPLIKKTKRHVIVTQKRVGEDTIYLSDKFPRLYQYLRENEHFFKQRKSSIYKNKPPFSIFGIGDYSFKPYKVAISGLYKRSTFSLILSENGKPVMLDDTCYFLGFDSLSEAIFIWAILNSRQIQQLLKAIRFLDAKRPYTKDILMRISIDKIAKDISYNEIINQIKLLEGEMSVNTTKDKWNAFVKQMDKRTLEKEYPLLFEVSENERLPQTACTL